MKFFVSYFYQIRYFKPYQIPFSTAIWDPKWFHAYRNSDYTFLDKNGVLNGLRIKYLRPGIECSDLCRGPEGRTELRRYQTGILCPFLYNYKKQLANLDYDEFRNYFDLYIPKIKTKIGFNEEPEVIFIVHEAPNNKCSEREMILNVLPQNGVNIQEWKR